jgi:hypothetical protein
MWCGSVSGKVHRISIPLKALLEPPDKNRHATEAIVGIFPNREMQWIVDQNGSLCVWKWVSGWPLRRKVEWKDQTRITWIERGRGSGEKTLLDESYFSSRIARGINTPTITFGALSLSLRLLSLSFLIALSIASTPPFLFGFLIPSVENYIMKIFNVINGISSKEGKDRKKIGELKKETSKSFFSFSSRAWVWSNKSKKKIQNKPLKSREEAMKEEKKETRNKKRNGSVAYHQGRHSPPPH